MTYEKQTWISYDDNKTEEQNIQEGAVVTAERMNHLETGLDEHDRNTTNPHKVTKAQVGLSNVTNVEQASKTEFNSHSSNKINPHGVTKTQVGLSNVDNYGTATQAEAEIGSAPDKFMTPERSKQHLDKRIATQTEAEGGTSSEKLMTSSRTKQHVDSRMATQEEVDEGEATDKLVSPKTLAGFNKVNIPLEVYISHKSTVVELDGVISGNKFPIGDIQSIDLFHTIDDLPFTLSSDKTTLTMKRDATLLIQQLQEGRGNSSASYTDYFYFYFNGGTTRYDGIKYGIDAGGTAINLSHTGMAQCVMNLKAGDVIWTSVSTRSTDRKLWKGSVRGTYIKEMKSV